MRKKIDMSHRDDINSDTRTFKKHSYVKKINFSKTKKKLSSSQDISPKKFSFFSSSSSRIPPRSYTFFKYPLTQPTGEAEVKKVVGLLVFECDDITVQKR